MYSFAVDWAQSTNQLNTYQVFRLHGYRYVGKRYRRQRPPSQYLQDVTCQKTARFLVTLFNYALNDLRYTATSNTCHWQVSVS